MRNQANLWAVVLPFGHRVDSIISTLFMFAHSPWSFACPMTDGADIAPHRRRSPRQGNRI